MESLKRALESIGRLWAGLNATRRVILSAAAALMVLLLIWGSVGSSESWAKVGAADPNLTRVLQERNQRYEIRGSDLMVPKADADRVVSELAGEGKMSTNAVWKYLEQSDVFATRWHNEKRYQIALQTRLEGMIRSIESVRNASVVINPGSTNYQLGFAGPKPSASVQVELQEGRGLSRKNVQAIAGLVASAVQGIEISQVHIMDTRGTPYRVAEAMDLHYEGFYEYQKQIELDIQEKIKSAFAFSAASVIVGIQAKNIRQDTEEVKHGKATVIEADERTRVRKGGGGAPSGLRKGEGGPEPDSSARGDETDREVQEKSAIDRKTTVEHLPGGEIQRVTIGVLIPVEEGPAFADAEKLLPKLREFVLKARPEAKDQDVSVQLIPTKRPEPIPTVAASVRAIEWLTGHAVQITLAALALAGLFVLFRIVRGAMARDTVEELQALTAALTETREAAAELGMPAEGDLGRLKQGLREMVGRSPQTVAASLKSFMSGR